MSTTHRQNKVESTPESKNPESVAEVQTSAQEQQPAELGIMDTIRDFKRRGLSAKQVKKLGYARQTVDQVFLEGVVPEEKVDEGGHEGAGEEVDEEEKLPATVKGTESVTPEFILRRLSDGSPEWALRLEGMMLLRAAQKMVREDIAIYDGLVAAQAKAMEGQLKVLREAKSESEEVALKAAAAVGEQVIDFMGQALKQKQDIATVANPFEGMIARMLETAMTGFMKPFLPKEAQAEMGTPGVTVEKRKREG